MTPKHALCLVFLVWISCTKTSTQDTIPVCISDKINAIQNEAVRNPPAKLYQYTYQNHTVYFFSSFCCDVFSELYDRNCNLICHPDGGITGMGDGRCKDFLKYRQNEKLIWEDKRENAF